MAKESKTFSYETQITPMKITGLNECFCKRTFLYPRHYLENVSDHSIITAQDSWQQDN